MQSSIYPCKYHNHVCLCSKIIILWYNECGRKKISPGSAACILHNDKLMFFPFLNLRKSKCQTSVYFSKAGRSLFFSPHLLCSSLLLYSIVCSWQLLVNTEKNKFLGLIGKKSRCHSNSLRIPKCLYVKITFCGCFLSCPQEGTAAKHFCPHTPASNMQRPPRIKQSYPKVASDKGTTRSIGCADSKTFIICFDSFLIAKYFQRQILPQGQEPLAFPSHSVSLCFYLLFQNGGWGWGDGGGISLVCYFLHPLSNCYKKNLWYSVLPAKQNSMSE